ncbi:hypothetical protein B0H19DRAFT_970285, partial [Mycena capillaripes]
GDIGRLYECIKALHAIYFRGSTHSNYLNYVLETIMNLELECSPGLKLALLRRLCFNRLLEDVVEHKSAQFDDTFIHNIISRNPSHIAQLKFAWRTGMGMEKKAHKHADPHTKPEMRKVYSDAELSQRRLTCQIDDRGTDDFARGVKKLRMGSLQTAIERTAHNRQVSRTDAPKPSSTTIIDADKANSGDESRNSRNYTNDTWT